MGEGALSVEIRDGVPFLALKGFGLDGVDIPTLGKLTLLPEDPSTTQPTTAASDPAQTASSQLSGSSSAGSEPDGYGGCGETRAVFTKTGQRLGQISAERNKDQYVYVLFAPADAFKATNMKVRIYGHVKDNGPGLTTKEIQIQYLSGLDLEGVGGRSTSPAPTSSKDFTPDKGILGTETRNERDHLVRFDVEYGLNSVSSTSLWVGDLHCQQGVSDTAGELSNGTQGGNNFGSSSDQFKALAGDLENLQTGVDSLPTDVEKVVRDLLEDNVLEPTDFLSTLFPTICIEVKMTYGGASHSLSILHRGSDAPPDWGKDDSGKDRCVNPLPLSPELLAAGIPVGLPLTTEFPPSDDPEDPAAFVDKFLRGGLQTEGLPTNTLTVDEVNVMTKFGDQQPTVVEVLDDSSKLSVEVPALPLPELAIAFGGHGFRGHDDWALTAISVPADSPLDAQRAIALLRKLEAVAKKLQSSVFPGPTGGFVTKSIANGAAAIIQRLANDLPADLGSVALGALSDTKKMVKHVGIGFSKGDLKELPGSFKQSGFGGVKRGGDDVGGNDDLVSAIILGPAKKAWCLWENDNYGGAQLCLKAGRLIQIVPDFTAEGGARGEKFVPSGGGASGKHRDNAGSPIKHKRETAHSGVTSWKWQTIDCGAQSPHPDCPPPLLSN